MANYLSIRTGENLPELQSLIDTTEAEVSRRVGPLAPVDLIESHDGGSVVVKVFKRPVISVASVTESYGTLNHTLTEQPLSGVNGFDAYGYTVEKESGTFTRRSAGQSLPFAVGDRNITIAYRAGWSTDGTINTLDPGILGALKELIRGRWSDAKRGPQQRPDTPPPSLDDLFSAWPDPGIY